VTIESKKSILCLRKKFSLQPLPPTTILNNPRISNLGDNISTFASSIDTQHPDIVSVLNGQFTATNSDSLNQILADFLAVSNKSWLLDNYKTILENHPYWSQLSRYIDDPKRNLLYTRLVKDKETRDFIRGCKKLQRISIANILTKETWEIAHSNFGSFLRHILDKNPRIEESKKRYHHFMNIGCSDIGGRIQLSIIKMEELLKSNTYLGFNRISLVDTAIILAKLIGCEYSQESNVVSIIEDKIARNGATNKKEYQAYAYPLHIFKNHFSIKIKNVIEYLDNLTELHEKPAFDHFRLIVPSIVGENNIDFDINLVTNDIVPSILLGERNGVFYFICYWI
jgi:hypothetical protein